MADGSSLLLGLNASLLGDEIGKGIEITAAIVVGGLIANAIEEFESREALNAEALAEIPLSVGIDLRDLDLVLGVLEGGGELLVNGRKVLAVAAPGSKELDERGLARL